MALPTAFQLALDVFELNDSRDPERRRCWQSLEPRMDAIVDHYVALLAAHTPFYRELTTTKRDQLKQHVCRHTGALFNGPFDEEWVAATRQRVEQEIEFGLDIRNRCVINRVILTDLCRHLAGRHRFAGAHGLDPIEVAIRVLMLDTTNAVALHYHTAVREAEARSVQLNDAIESYGQAIGGVRHTVNIAVASLAETSNQLTGLAGTAADQANKATAAAESTVRNADQMANSIEEMHASISAIREQASDSAMIARETHSTADGANRAIQSLSDHVSRIGSVVKLISEIAAQTNLLALNAAIEAARAGESGRGFAVVAAEVKSLATQTSKATKEIGEQIAGVQETTLKSVNEIAETGQSVGSIAELSEALAASVNEQAAATGQIAAGSSGAAANATVVADALKSVAETIQRTQSLAAVLLDSSRQLAERTREADAAMDSLFLAAALDRGVKKIADLKKSMSS